MSPSSRRAWIEMAGRGENYAALFVALLAEGVDRNLSSWKGHRPVSCRPPRGGRG